jgi:uncharacterized protein (DUF58 family)
MKLTDPEFIRQLETLYLLARKVLSGRLKAERRTRKLGGGILFADYAEYNYGDDYRRIDWKIYGRLEQLVVKLFEVEEDVPVFLLIDTSRSMAAKLDYALRLVAALGYIALNSLDRLAVYRFDDRLAPVFALSHGRGRSLSFLRLLEDVACSGSDTKLEDCMRAFHGQGCRRGICVLVSDFFTPDGYDESLNLLQWAGHDLYCLQVVDPLELTCDWKGDVELECAETGKRRQLTVGPAEASRYARAMQDWNARLARECARREIGYFRTTIDIPFHEVVQTILRRGGLVS